MKYYTTVQPNISPGITEKGEKPYFSRTQSKEWEEKEIFQQGFSIQPQGKLFSKSNHYFNQEPNKAY